jgi:6-phosphogluconolactonase/glucosamine-6-phosphate isomerase/deaminase
MSEVKVYPDRASLARAAAEHFVTRASEAVVARELFVVALAHVTFLVAGAGKAERLHQVLAGPYQPDVLPAQIVRPADGQLLWLVEGER